MATVKPIIVLFALTAIQTLQAQNLTETFQLALQNDPDYKSAYLQQFSTAEFKSQSIAQMLPQIGFTGSSSRDRLNNTKPSAPGPNQAQGGAGASTFNYWNNSLSFDLTQPVFHWDHWVQLAQADNRIAQTEAQFQANYQAIIVNTTEAYFNILAAQDNLAFTVAEKTAIAKQLEQARQRFEVGLIAITDVYEAQAAYDQATANEIEAQNQLDNSHESLRELTGHYAESIQPLQTKIPLQLPEPANIDTWTESAENSNFTIIAQLNETEVSRKNIDIQQSGHLPTLDIVGSYRVIDNTAIFGLRGDTQSIGLQVNVPIFSGGNTYSKAKQAEYDFQIAKERLIKVRRTVTREVRNAYRGVVSSYSRVKALAATVKSSESALEASEAGFEVGTRTMVDVLAEQRNLYRSKRDYARSRYDYLVNGIKLKNSAGSLVETDLEQINQLLQN